MCSAAPLCPKGRIDSEGAHNETSSTFGIISGITYLDLEPELGSIVDPIDEVRHL